MGIEPPFLYDRPASYRWDAQLDRGFNPRAATQAAWAKAQKEKEKAEEPKPEGPLIDVKEINKHPDSYFIVPYGNLDFEPLSRRTRKTIIWSRWLQLALRVLSLIGSLGMLVCMILIIPAGDGSDWIIRIPPAVMIIHSLYGIWHLSRRAGGRTPASSASYFIFGAIIDLVFIPFMLFNAWTVRSEWLQALADPSSDTVWKTLVDYLGVNVKTTIFFVTWIDSVVLGGLSLVNFVICVYLALKFRKISALPPDMNPFEENLTSRASKRHKKDKPSTSDLSSKLDDSARNSTASLLNEKQPGVPWMHTRNGSTNTLQSNSAPSSPTKSRPDSGIGMLPEENHLGQLRVINGSKTSISNPKRRQGHARNDSMGSVLPPKAQAPQSPLRQSMPPGAPRTAPTTPHRYDEDSRIRAPTREANASPGAASSVYSDADSWYTDAPDDGRSLHSSPSNKVVNQANYGPGKTRWPLKGVPEKGENEWFAIGEASDDDDDDDHRKFSTPRNDAPELVHLRSAPSHTVNGSPPSHKYDFANRSPRPLEMHPPTPPGSQRQPVSPNARMSYPQHHQSPSPQSQRMSYPQHQQEQHGMGSPYANREARRTRAALQPASHGTSNRGMHKVDWADGSGLGDRDDAATRMLQPQQQQQNLTPGRRNGERVISSGYEDERQTLSLRNSSVKNRQVSGKVAEEGRGGVGWGIGSGMSALRAQMGW